MIRYTCSKGLCYQGTTLVIPMSPGPPPFLSPPEDRKGLQLVSTCSFPLLQKVLLSSEQQSWKYSLSRKTVSSWKTDASKFLLEQSLRLHLWIIYLLNLPLKCKWNKLTLVQLGSVEFVMLDMLGDSVQLTELQTVMPPRNRWPVKRSQYNHLPNYFHWKIRGQNQKGYPQVQMNTKKIINGWVIKVPNGW